MGIKITEEFKQLYDLLENKNRNVVLLGSAGTGKSTFLKWYKENTKKKMLFLSPTGIAALNIGGATIHSFFGFPFKPLTPQDITNLKEYKRKILKYADIIVIDEISMLKPDILDGISWSMQLNLSSTKPFAGKQILLVGDMFQLSPIVNKGIEWFYQNIYKSCYFFSSKKYQESHFENFVLTHIFRQEDKEFIKHLNEIRLLKPTAETLEYFNKRCNICNDKDILTITSFVKTADYINATKLAQINNEPKTYKAIINGIFNVKQMLTPEELTVKVGAKVMFTKNDKEERYKNGTFGVIKRLAPNSITVMLENGLQTDITREKWIAYDYVWNEKERKFDEQEKGSFEQFPMMLGYAVTVHKIQGQTCSKIKIDLGSGAFAPGQLYVALSRCTDYNNIYLAHPIKLSDVVKNNEILEWWNKIGAKILV